MDDKKFFAGVNAGLAYTFKLLTVACFVAAFFNWGYCIITPIVGFIAWLMARNNNATITYNQTEHE